MSAYQSGPVRDKNGTYHLAWVWRDTYDCSTNHSVSYACSLGSLENWQKSDGTPIQLPLTIHNTEILDPVPVKSGLLNNIKLSFDTEERPMVTYFKYDPKGRTQIYTMRLEGDRWRRYQTTNWKDRYEFSGGGSIDTMISFTTPSRSGPGEPLHQVFTNRFLAPYAQIRVLDPATLQQISKPVRLYPPSFETPSREGEWQVNLGGFDFMAAKREGSSWVLRWETMKPHRDRPREEEPPPSRLELVELKIAKRQATKY